MGMDNPLDQPNPFAVGAPPIPLEGIPQGQTPMGNLGGLAGKVAPWLIPGIPPWMAALNMMGGGLPDWVKNPTLLSAIMQNDPSQQAGPEWEAGARGNAARAALSPSPYGYTPSPLMQSDLSAAGYGLEPEGY